MLLGDEWKRQQQGGMISIPELHKNTTMKDKSEACISKKENRFFVTKNPFKAGPLWEKENRFIILNLTVRPSREHSSIIRDAQTVLMLAQSCVE
jgi:hypothetical protein